MKEQNWRNLMDDRKQKVHTLTVIAQLQQDVDRTTRKNLLSALETLNKAEQEANELIEDIRKAMAEHREAGNLLKKEAAARRQQSEQLDSDNAESETAPKDKGRARDSEDPEILDDDDDDLPQNAAGQEHRIKHRALQQRLRECQITMHRVRFLQGDVHHSLGRTEEENASYAAAEELRRILLQSRLCSLSIVKGFILIHVCRRRYGACGEACNATASAGSY